MDAARFTRRVRDGALHAVEAVLAGEPGGDHTEADFDRAIEASAWLRTVPDRAVVIVFTEAEAEATLYAIGCGMDNEVDEQI